MISDQRLLGIAAIVYAVAGIAAYWSILGAGFLGDDWMFLDLIERAKNALVAFAPLNGRYTRPLIVLVYYFNYRWFGLWPVPAHGILLALHIANSWLVCVFVLRLARPISVYSAYSLGLHSIYSVAQNQLIAFGSGLLFLVFAGHSEAISWVAGMADALVVPFAIGSLLLLDRAIVADRPVRAIVLACGRRQRASARIATPE